MTEADFRNLIFLQQLEEYIPYMLEEELIYIIFVGSLPSAESLARWDYLKTVKESAINSRFARANEWQRLQKNCKCGKLHTPTPANK